MIRGPDHPRHRRFDPLDARVQATRFGRALPPGGTIGVCAPSGPFYNASDILRPKEWWESNGYRVKLTDGSGGGPSLAEGDSFGVAMAALGDLDGDEIPDLAHGFAPFSFNRCLERQAACGGHFLKLLAGLGPTLAQHQWLLEEFGK